MLEYAHSNSRNDLDLTMTPVEIESIVRDENFCGSTNLCSNLEDPTSPRCPAKLISICQCSRYTEHFNVHALDV